MPGSVGFVAGRRLAAGRIQAVVSVIWAEAVLVSPQTLVTTVLVWLIELRMRAALQTVS